VLVKFNNGSCQMMTPVELSNLFKCKQKAIRESVLLVETMVCASSFQEIRVKIDLTERQYVLGLDELYERAKNEVKMINDHIKPKDFMFVP
jgi:CRISPR/Cas system-associated exonuclease Cas4 (RecB family)